MTVSPTAKAYLGPSIPELLLERACLARGSSAVGEPFILMTPPCLSQLKHLLKVQGRAISNDSLADGAGHSYPSDSCNRNRGAQSEAASRSAYFTLALSIPNFATVGVVASLADSIGRKPAMLFGLAGFAAAAAAIAGLPGGAVCLHPGGGGGDEIDWGSSSGAGGVAAAGSGCIDGFWLLLAVTGLFSLTGGSKGTTTVFFTVMADLTAGASPKVTAMGFAAVEAAGFAGQAPGLVLAGYSAGWFGLQYSFVLALAAFLACAMLLPCLPETQPAPGPGGRARFSCAKANPAGTLLVLLENPTSRRAWAMDLLGGCAMAGAQSIQPLFAKKIDGLTDVENGYLQTTWSLAILAGLLLVFPALQRRLTLRQLVVLAYASTAVTTAAWGLLTLPAFRGRWNGVPVWPFALQASCVFNAWSYSALRTAIARSFPAERVGVAIGAFSTSNIICFALGRLIWATAYGSDWGSRSPGLLMWAAGAAVAACVPIALTLPDGHGRGAELEQTASAARRSAAAAQAEDNDRLSDNAPLIRPSWTSPRLAAHETAILI